MKLRFTMLAILLMPLFAKAQNIPFVQIQNIQGWQGQFLPDTCNDGPNPQYLNDTVKVRAVVITNGGLNETSGQTRWIWVRDVTAGPSTPFANISVRNPTATTPQDINTFVAGDTIEVIGVVQEFAGSGAAGETQLTPIANGVSLISFEAGPAPQSVLVSVGELNGPLNASNQPTNRVSTGEKYEGNFVEIQNVTVTAVNVSGGRCNFLVKDANENYIRIYDRFKTQRPANGFVPPNVGDQFTSIKGIIEGSKNGCPGSGQNNLGYNMNPFSVAHYVKGASSPAIGNIKKNTACPLSGTDVTLSASVTDDGSVSEVKFFYSTNGLSYTEVTAVANGNRYSATIPGQPAGTTVRYYIRARDNLNNTTIFPNVPAQVTPLFYNVGTSGCTIRDIQFTPYSAGRSGYVGDTLSIQGVVTASAGGNNLGYVYIQQPNETEWAGIWVNGGSLISGFNVGDLVSVTGVVEEYFNFTRISNISAANLVSANQPVPAPVVLNPALFTTNSDPNTEKYESMLVRLQNPAAGQNLFVVDTNADAATGRNNGEYRVGADAADPNTGCRVLAGRQSSSTFSSLNVSFVNSPRWATVDGTMAVTPIIVQPSQEVTLIQGIMHYSFFNYKLLPRNNDDVAMILSVEENLKSKGFAVFPNPNHGEFSLQLQDQNKGGQLEVFNAQGQKVFSSFVKENLQKFQLPVSASGIYKVRIADSKGNLLGIESISVQK
jgi:hypothetical protein